MTRSEVIAISLLVTLTLWSVASLASAEPRVVDLPVHNGELPPDKRLVRVQQSDEVTLRWTTNTPLTIHLHGYDIEETLSPGGPVSMRFTARATGRFPIEIHAHGGGVPRTLGYLEVHPR